ncbi:MAG: hypothetical protein ACQETO_11380 [Pseudomonadota bacterium]
MKWAERSRMTAVLVAISLPGIVLVALWVPGMVADLDVELPPPAVLVLVSAIQTLVLVTAMAALGAWLAPKVNLGAPVLAGSVPGRPPFSMLASQARVAIPVGTGIGVLIVAVEVMVFRPWLPDELYLLGTPLTFDYWLAGLLYGGIVEEVLLRWGAMSLFAWLVFRALGRRRLALALLLGNALAAILFGVGHLPAVNTIVGELTMPVIVRTLVLNAVPGFVFGLFFQHRGLEAAMLAHMGAHLGMAVPRLIFGA